MTTQKAKIRQQARRVRDQINISQDNPEDAALHFAEHFSDISKETVIAGYWPKGHEFDPRPIMERLMYGGYTCALPVMRPDTKILSFVRFDAQTPLQDGRYGIKEPAINDDTDYVQPGVVLVPMLAFDRRGNRLGQGGGYYDATLAALRAKKKVMAIGVAYAQQACLFSLPTEEHDQRLDYIVTPRGVMRFI